MKAIVAILLISIAVGQYSCKKNNPPINDDGGDPIDTLVQTPIDTHIIGLGKVYVEKNGVKWTPPSFKAYFSHSDSAFLINTSEFYGNGVRHTFMIDDIPCKKGVYSFEFWPSESSILPNQIPQVAYIMMYDGDQPIGDFLLDTLNNNSFIEVINYDSITHIAEGRFQAYTKKNDPHNGIEPFPGVPDSIALLNGKFRLEVVHF